MAVTSATWRPILAGAARAPAAGVARSGGCRGFGRAAEDLAAARLRGRGARAAGAAREDDRPARVPAPGRRLRRVVQRDLDDADPREAEDHAADVRRAHLRRGAAGREGRADRRAVHEAALRRRSSNVDGDEMPSFRGHMVNDDESTAEARVPDPERMLEGYNQSASTLNLVARVHEGRLRRPDAGALWNQEFVASSPEGRRYEELARRSSARSRSWPRAGSISRPSAAAARGRRLHVARRAAARLRGGADAPGLADRRLVRLLRAHAVDRRADAAARRRARRVLRRRPQPDRREARAGGDARGGRRAVRAARTRCVSRAG